MDNNSGDLINELKQGRELAKQLQVHLNVPSSPHESRELLVHKILTSYDKALSMLKTSTIGLAAGELPQFVGMGIGGKSESPRSFSSEDSDREFKDPDQKDASRKSYRKSGMQRWSQQVEVRPVAGLQGPLDDGYSWRKYGQKDILGAKFPRGYYRCTHRIVEGCLATKQVQRNDDNPTIFEITYRGKHTCTQQSPPPLPPVKQEPINQPPQNHPQTPDMLLNFQTGLKVITQNLDDTTPEPELHSFPSFHFGSTSNVGINDSLLIADNNFPANYSPSFISPATSGSNYLSVSPTSNFHASDCELSEVVSAATNATTDQGLGFPFGQMEFDHNFTFDNPSFFS